MAQVDPCAGLKGTILYDVCQAMQGGIPQKAAAGAGVVNSTVGNAAKKITDPIAQLAAALATLSSPSTWIRVGLFLGVLVLLIIGFTVLVSGQVNK